MMVELTLNVVSGGNEAGGGWEGSAVVVGPAGMFGAVVEGGGGELAGEEVGFLVIGAAAFVVVEAGPEGVFVGDLVEFADDELVAVVGRDQTGIGAEVIEQAADLGVGVELGVRLDQRVVRAEVVAALRGCDGVGVVFAEGAVDEEGVGHVRRCLPGNYGISRGRAARCRRF